MNKMKESTEKARKRFRFNYELDKKLIDIVVITETHKTGGGSLDKKFESVLAMFLATPEYLSYHAIAGAVIPQVSTVRDRFRALVAARRRAVKRNIAASGIEEITTELDEDLDRLIEEVDADKEIKAKEKEAAEGQEKKILDAGSSVRARAMKRIGNSDDSDCDTPKKKKKKNSRDFFEFKEDEELMKLESKRLELQERRLVLDEKQDAASERQDKLMMGILEVFKTLTKKG